MRKCRLTVNEEFSGFSKTKRWQVDRLATRIPCSHSQPDGSRWRDRERHRRLFGDPQRKTPRPDVRLEVFGRQKRLPCRPDVSWNEVIKSKSKIAEQQCAGWKPITPVSKSNFFKLNVNVCVLKEGGFYVFKMSTWVDCSFAPPFSDAAPEGAGGPWPPFGQFKNVFIFTMYHAGIFFFFSVKCGLFCRKDH